MWSSRQAFESDRCPVSDDLLGAMYRANENGLPHLVASVPGEVRAMLALFCYRRNHMHALAISIASSCTERDLIEHGGRVGSTLYALAHDPQTPRGVSVSAYSSRKAITLSTKPLSTLAPLDDDLDDDIEVERDHVVA